MKFYILPVGKKFQPGPSSQRAPLHNRDYGIEQDFLLYLQQRKDLLCQDPKKADWHYLPIFWTRWHVAHDRGRKGISQLQKEVDKQMIEDRKSFTICQRADGPLVKLGQTLKFLASRKTDSGLDVPLLSNPHKKPFFEPSKKYLASFIGHLSTHPIRQKMAESLEGQNDIYIFDGLKSSRFFIERVFEKHIPLFPKKGSRFFVRKMLESYIALCPRGYGGSSFRFYEAMQLGITPFLIGDVDTRPFKKFINWDTMSFYSKTVSGLNDRLNELRNDDLKRVLSMGKRVAEFWKKNLTYQRWCYYLIKELEELK